MSEEAFKDTKPERLYVDPLDRRNKAARALWQITRVILFASLHGPLFKRWRIFLLRRFGATIGQGCRIEASCKIWWPGNLQMGDFSCLAGDVDCYNVAPIRLGNFTTVSQRAFLCTASHATDTLARPLIHAPITIKTHAWVCAEAFVGPGTTVEEGAVLGARGVATHDLEAWTIHVGNPARVLKPRIIR